MVRLKDVNVAALQHYLKAKPLHQRATISKLLHRWISTYAQLAKSNQCHMDVCPWCHQTPETATHILCCNNEIASQSHSTRPYDTLKVFEDMKTDMAILQSIEKKLSNALNIRSREIYDIHNKMPKASNHTPEFSWMGQHTARLHIQPLGQGTT